MKKIEPFTIMYICSYFATIQLIAINTVGTRIKNFLVDVHAVPASGSSSSSSSSSSSDSSGSSGRGSVMMIV